jgi:two-component system, response regulator PdtaR
MGLRTLIVDDHEILGAGLACMLTELGHEVLDIVGTGEEAIESASRHKPDLIIMDVNLEGDMDGIAAATAIRQQLGIRSIFFSGYSDEDTRQRAAAADPIAFLDKTTSKEELARVIGKTVPDVG